MRNWLIAIREEKGFSQAYVAKAIGVKLPTYWEYEHGDCRPKLATGKKLAMLLGFNLELLYPELRDDKAN